MRGLKKGAPWEFIRPSKRFTVEFGGNIHFEGKKMYLARYRKK